MTEPASEYEKLLRAARALGERHEFVVHPVEEDEQVAAAAEDEARLRGQRTGTTGPMP